MELSAESLESILDPYRGRRGVLLEALHKVQESYGYIPQEALGAISKALNQPPSLIYGTITFYAELRTQPPPATLVEICLGPTCHLRGARIIKGILEDKLGIGEEGVTADGKVGIRVMQCAGHCHLAPLLYVNHQPRRNVRVRDAVLLAEETLGRNQEGSKVLE